MERIAEREETAERRSQAPNGSATAIRDVSGRDERALCEVERAWSQGKRGDRKPWNGAKSALVTVI